MSRNSDFWLSLVLLGFSALVAGWTVDVPSAGTGGTLGPSFLPWTMIVGIAVFALMLLWRSQRQGQVSIASPNLHVLAKLAGFLLLMLVYAAIYEPVGYVISSLAFFIVGLLALGERRWLQVALVPPAVVGGVYLVFAQVMKVYLP